MKRITMLAAATAAMFGLTLQHDTRDAAARLINPPPEFQTSGIERLDWPGVIWDAPLGCDNWTCVYTTPPSSANTTRSSTEKPVCESSSYGTSTDGGSQKVCAYSNGDGYWQQSSWSAGQMIVETGSVVTNADKSQTIRYSMFDGTST